MIRALSRYTLNIAALTALLSLAFWISLNGHPVLGICGMLALACLVSVLED